MPRRPPHFKAFTSIKNHRKLEQVYGNNDLLALWLRLGIEAVERFADRTGDSFIVNLRELPALTGRGRVDSARKVLDYLATSSPLVVNYSETTCRITFPNFAKKQGFGVGNGRETESSASASATANKKGLRSFGRIKNQSERVRRRQLAQEMYSLRNLLKEPTEEALAEWEAKGKPQDCGWWLEASDRKLLRLIR